MAAVVGFVCGFVVGVVATVLVSMVVNSGRISEAERRHYPDQL